MHYDPRGGVLQVAQEKLAAGGAGAFQRIRQFVDERRDAAFGMRGVKGGQAAVGGLFVGPQQQAGAVVPDGAVLRIADGGHDGQERFAGAAEVAVKERVAELAGGTVGHVEEGEALVFGGE